MFNYQFLGTSNQGLRSAQTDENNIAIHGAVIARLKLVLVETDFIQKQVASLVGCASISFTEILINNAYVHLSLSADDLATSLAQENNDSNRGNNADSTELKDTKYSIMVLPHMF
ncbi:MAG: putative XRE-type DNA-binding protein [Mariniflexile sp.]